jgi:GMP synthase-like glutamine amidotransferase
MSSRTLHIAVLTHVPFEGPEAIEVWFQARGHTVDRIPLHAGCPLSAARRADILVVMGGPMSAGDTQTYPWLRDEFALLEAALARRTPLLGVCLGAQLIAAAAGASVYPNRVREIGWWPVDLTGAGIARDEPAATWRAPFSGGRCVVFQWHGDTFSLPSGARQLARTDVCENQAFAVGDRVIGLQFHLESTPSSVRRIASECRHEIGYTPYERRSGVLDPVEAMVSDARRYEGAGRPLLSAVLDRLERAAFGDTPGSR